MTQYKGLFLTLTIVITSLMTSAAHGLETEEQSGAFRITALGSFLISSAVGNYENVSNTNLDGSLGNLLLEFGKGMISFEGGVSFLKNSDIEQHPDTAGTNHPLLINYESIGIPIHIKFNYIDKPLSTFYVKLGLMPTFVKWQNAERLQLKESNDFRVVAGIGGTTDLNETVAFVLDISAIYNLTHGGSINPNPAAYAGIGFSFQL